MYLVSDGVENETHFIEEERAAIIIKMTKALSIKKRIKVLDK